MGRGPGGRSRDGVARWGGVIVIKLTIFLEITFKISNSIPLLNSSRRDPPATPARGSSFDKSFHVFAPAGATCSRHTPATVIENDVGSRPNRRNLCCDCFSALSNQNIARSIFGARYRCKLLALRKLLLHLRYFSIGARLQTSGKFFDSSPRHTSPSPLCRQSLKVLPSPARTFTTAATSAFCGSAIRILVGACSISKLSR